MTRAKKIDLQYGGLLFKKFLKFSFYELTSDRVWNSNCNIYNCNHWRVQATDWHFLKITVHVNSESEYWVRKKNNGQVS